MIRIILYIFFIFLVASCTAQKAINPKKLNELWFVYEISSQENTPYPAHITQAIDSMVLSMDPTINLDTLKTKIAKLRKKYHYNSNNYTYVKLINDGWIWQRDFGNNRKTDLHRFNTANDTVRIYDPDNSERLLNSFVRQRLKYDFTIEKKLDSTKIIHGTKCYYAKVTGILKEETRRIWGDEIYEMFINPTIYSPMNAVLDEDCVIKNLFPYQIKKYTSRTPDNYTLYQLKEIRKDKP